MLRMEGEVFVVHLAKTVMSADSSIACGVNPIRRDSLTLLKNFSDGVKVLVGSRNPVKIEATREAFSKYCGNPEITGVEVDSRVPVQPVNEQIFEGAENRAKTLIVKNKVEKLSGEFFVGIEGGIIKLHSRWFSFGGMCIMDNKGRIGFGTSPLFELPLVIVEELLRGVELGDVMDHLQGECNTKQKHGAIGFFTKGVIDRKNFYMQGLVTALIPFVNRELF